MSFNQSLLPFSVSFDHIRNDSTIRSWDMVVVVHTFIVAKLPKFLRCIEQGVASKPIISTKQRQIASQLILIRSFAKSLFIKAIWRIACLNVNHTTFFNINDIRTICNAFVGKTHFILCVAFYGITV